MQGNEVWFFEKFENWVDQGYLQKQQVLTSVPTHAKRPLSPIKIFKFQLQFHRFFTTWRRSISVHVSFANISIFVYLEFCTLKHILFNYKIPLDFSVKRRVWMVLVSLGYFWTFSSLHLTQFIKKTGPLHPIFFGLDLKIAKKWS